MSMERTNFIVALLSVCSLVSCGGSKEPVSFFFDQSNTTPTYSTSLRYSEVCVLESAESVIKQASSGRNKLLILASESCSSCLAFRRSFARFVCDNSLSVSLFLNSEIDVTINASFNRNLSVLTTNYEDFFTNREIYTPSMFMLGDDKKIEEIEIFKGTDSAINWNSVKLRNYMLGISSISNVTRAEKRIPKDALSSFSFVYEESEEEQLSSYLKTTYPLARTSPKPTYEISYSSLDDGEKAILDSLSKDIKAPYYLIKGQAYSLDDSTIQKTINSYFEVAETEL